MASDIRLGRWKETVDMTELWKKAESGEIPATEFCKAMVRILSLVVNATPALAAIIELFQEFGDEPETDYDDVDLILDSLYNWADMNRVWLER